jgi:hypothetical protein
MMKKIKYLFFVLLVVFISSCNKEDEKVIDQEEELTTELLKSKDWLIAKYVTQISCGGMPGFDFDPTEEAWWCMGSEKNECDSEDYCTYATQWEEYLVKFLPSIMNGTFSFNTLEAVVEEGCFDGYQDSQSSTQIENPWSYNASEKILTVNFGNIFDLFDDGNIMNMDYQILSWSESNIEMKAEVEMQGCKITSIINLDGVND